MKQDKEDKQEEQKNQQVEKVNNGNFNPKATIQLGGISQIYQQQPEQQSAQQNGIDPRVWNQTLYNGLNDFQQEVPDSKCKENNFPQKDGSNNNQEVTQSQIYQNCQFGTLQTVDLENLHDLLGDLGD
jgi:hypothetical protein